MNLEFGMDFSLDAFRQKNLKIVLMLALVSSLVIFIFPASAFANPNVQFYKIDIGIDEEGKSSVQLAINFKEPERQFSMSVLGRIENFEATSNAGPVDCKVDVSGTSTVICSMNLTRAQKEMQITFTTSDFVRALEGKFYFSGDLSLKTPISEVSATLRLPRGFLLVGEDISSSILSYPKNASAHISGENIIIVWKLSSTSETEPLKFEVLYEQVTPPPWFELRMRHFVLLGATFAVVIGFIVVRYLRKSESLVLSVLDEYERRVMDVITKEGEVKQRAVVQSTNLSKAKVSRVVKSLAGRGLIEVERRGRTNILRPVKKKLEA